MTFNASTALPYTHPRSPLRTFHRLVLSVLLLGAAAELSVSVQAQTYTYSIIYDFGARTNDGESPVTGLTLVGSTLYGSTDGGGDFGKGTIFSINSDGTAYTTLHSFGSVAEDGSEPTDGLTLVGSTLYGTTWHGGSIGLGTLFAINTDGTGFTNIDADFSSAIPDGFYPNRVTLVGSQLFGTTLQGGPGVPCYAEGTFSFGTIFRINTNGTGYSTVYNFGTVNSCTDGANPESGLTLVGSTLYGITSGGGTGPNNYGWGGIIGSGTIFSINTNGTGYTTLHNFLDNSSDGVWPYGGLTLIGSTLYGTTWNGGSNLDGTIFRINTDGSAYKVIYDFNYANAAVAPVGLTPIGSTLYSTTAYDGRFNKGTVFALNTDGTGHANVHQFGSVANDGAYPAAGLTLAGSTLYGTTQEGGRHGQGTIFALTRHEAGVDTTPPTLTITSPKSAQNVSNSLFVVTGSVSSKVTVTNVHYQLNGGGRMPATPGNTWNNWTASVTLNPGLNTISAYAIDASGILSATVTVAFKYIPSATLVVQINGTGKVTPNDGGKWLAIGTNYTLKAAPIGNNLFSNWVATGSENFVSNNPILNFIVQSNLSLTANFVPDFFLTAQGSYHGLFAPTNAARSQSNSGSFLLRLMPSGTFSGGLQIGTNTISLSGAFDVSGAATVPPVKNAKIPVTTTLQLNVADQTVQGMVTGKSFVAMLTGDQGVFTASHPASNYKGSYTFIIPGTTDPTIGPFGTSYGIATVGSTGTIAYSVYLADGTSALALSSAISKDGYWPLYAPLSSGTGSLWGWNYFSAGGVLLSPTNISWINITNPAKTALYSTGFSNQSAQLNGSMFNPKDKPSLALTSGEVKLVGGNLPSNITNQIALASNNTITRTTAPENTNQLVLTISKTGNGVISGTFANPASPAQKITVNGVLLQNQTNAQGYFRGTNQSGSFFLESQ